MSKHEARTSLLSGSSSDLTYTRSNYQQSMDHDTFAYGGYAHREGFQPTQPRETKKPSWAYVPNTKWTWAFAGVVLFQAVVALALEGYFFAIFQADLIDEARSKPFAEVVPTYLSLFIFGFVYELVLTYDALRLSNTIQIIGLCLYNLGLTIEAAVQVDQTQHAIDVSNRYKDLKRDDDFQSPYLKKSFWTDIKPIIITVPTFLGIITLVMSFCAYKLNDEFAWSIYKNISADLRLKKRFLTYQIYIALLKFDFFFFLAFTVQFLVILPRTQNASENAEFIITIIAIPVTICVLFLAALWTRRENIVGMVCTIVIYFGALAYFAFKLIRMYFSDWNHKRVYLPAQHSLTTFAVITLVLVVVTIVYAIICTANFHKGLKPHVQSTRKRRRAGSTDMDKLVHGNDVPLGPGPSNQAPVRMEID